MNTTDYNRRRISRIQDVFLLLPFFLSILLSLHHHFFEEIFISTQVQGFITPPSISAFVYYHHHQQQHHCYHQQKNIPTSPSPSVVCITPFIDSKRGTTTTTTNTATYHHSRCSQPSHLASQTNSYNDFSSGSDKKQYYNNSYSNTYNNTYNNSYNNTYNNTYNNSYDNTYNNSYDNNKSNMTTADSSSSLTGNGQTSREKQNRIYSSFTTLQQDDENQEHQVLSELKEDALSNLFEVIEERQYHYNNQRQQQQNQKGDKEDDDNERENEEIIIQILSKDELETKFQKNSIRSTNNEKNMKNEKKTILRPINSLVFAIRPQLPLSSSSSSLSLPFTSSATRSSSSSSSSTAYILAILDQRDRVNMTKLEQIVYSLVPTIDWDERRQDSILMLAPATKLVEFCGFEPGTVPPIGLHPSPILTIIEESLIENSDTEDEMKPDVWLVGGGGRHDLSTVLSAEALLTDYSNNSYSSSSPAVKVAPFRDDYRIHRSRDTIMNRNGAAAEEEPINSNDQRNVKITSSASSLPPKPISSTVTSLDLIQKPYFAIAPPDTAIVKQLIWQQRRERQMQQQKQENNYSRKNIYPTTSETTNDKSAGMTMMIQSEWVTTVGRISSIRRMARRLVFADLAPPYSNSMPQQEHEQQQKIKKKSTKKVKGTQKNNSNVDDDDLMEDIYPWRNPRDDQSMAVQLILGKTICQRIEERQGSDIDPEIFLRQIKRGQLVLVHGKTNTGNRDSLTNWLTKQSLDIIVFDVQILQDETPSHYGIDTTAISAAPAVKSPSFATTTTIYESSHSNGATTDAGRTPKKTTSPTAPHLEIQHILPDFEVMNELEENDAGKDSTILVVDNLEAALQFQREMTEWLSSSSPKIQMMTIDDDTANGSSSSGSGSGNGIEQTTRRVGLVGIDCEWKPRYLIDVGEQQSVLLLQICIYPLKKIYLLDLQSLLRPLVDDKDLTLNPIEIVVNESMKILLADDRYIKIGFQVNNDFQRLAASYPHLSGFQTVNAVLEASKLGIQAAAMATTAAVASPGSQQGSRRRRQRQNKNTKQARSAVASLSKMTETFTRKTLNKEQQCSDWSLRPLTKDQKIYAALDALVTPYIVDGIIQSMMSLPGGMSTNTTTTTTPELLADYFSDKNPKLSRLLTSWRFVLFETAKDSTEKGILQKLGAKRLVGDAFVVVTQSWMTGGTVPNLPSLMTVDDTTTTNMEGSSLATYTDVDGISRIAANAVAMDSTKKKSEIIESILGIPIAKSKEKCLLSLLRGNEKLKNGNWKLDFPQRSGYVELEDAVVLFVTLPKGRNSNNQARTYPNEWMEDGSIMSWFIRDYEWKGGSSDLALKMTQGKGKDLEPESWSPPTVVLFARRGKGHFVCCGRCFVSQLPANGGGGGGGGGSDKDEAIATKNGDETNDNKYSTLVQLYLTLLDWKNLWNIEEFQYLVDPTRPPRMKET